MDEIRTKRLLWREPRASDVDGYMAFVSDYEVVKWTSSWPHSENREFVASHCVPIAPDKGFAGPVFLGDEQIGGIGLIDGELGFFFARKHWGFGYATEMAAAIIARGFQNTALGQITAGVITGNLASSRVLEKLGFQRSGTSKCTSVAQGGEFPCVDYRLGRADWLAGNPLEIITDRLVVRPYQPCDAVAFHAIANRAEVARMLISVPHPFSLSQAATWIESRQYLGHLGFCVGVFLKDGALIGNLGIGGDPVSTMYFIDPQHWGRGYASEAMHGFVGWALDYFGLAEICAGAMAENPASVRVLEKLGFARTGQGECQSMARLEPTAEYLYRLTRDQFEALR